MLINLYNYDIFNDLTLIVMLFSIFFIELVITLIIAVYNNLRVKIYDVKFKLKLIRE